MSNGFLCKLEGDLQYRTIVWYQFTLILIVGRHRHRTVEVQGYSTTADARLGAVREVESAERSGLELYRVYSCPGSPALGERVADIYRGYTRNSEKVGGLADAVVSHVVANSTILFPTDWQTASVGVDRSTQGN